ncbi:hypothetical protein Slin15195_G066000 [Septoria linicola]|uniref:Uncharacterized protein n=1 Tax=Septoria linicola TaxID=215465 RepID=A0A9Q9EIZ5_9PEZI|nr:hypothetical protein Slin14017_G116330 [Septoria linicola]USW53281.1 hypothetical protein Slin15195_G066000 [Septoria linicola]
MPVRGSTRRGSLRPSRGSLRPSRGTLTPSRGSSRPILGRKRKAEEDDGPPAKRPLRSPSFTPSIASPVSSPVDPGLIKGKGKLREGGRRVAPRVEENAVLKRFPEVKSRQSKGIMNPSNLCYRNASLQ